MTIDPQPRPDSPEHLRLRLWVRLLRAVRPIESELRRRLAREFGFTLPKFDVMAALARREAGMTMTEVSRLLMVSNGNVTGLVDRLMRYEGEQILPGDRLPPAGAGGLLLNAMNIAPELEAEFNDWYDKEHIPALAAVPGVLCARRFRGTSGNRKYVALYHLAAPDVVESDEWKQARQSDWTSRLQPHFRDHLRLVLRRSVRGR